MAAPNGSHQSFDDQPAIDVAPINSVSYNGLSQDCFDSDMAQQNDVNVPLKYESAMVYLPKVATAKELDDILSVAKNGIMVSGSAAASMGPLIGSLDISESDDGYLFRVALPGVKKDETFECNIQTDGIVTVNGVTITGEKKIIAHKMVFEMRTHNFCPPGDFSVSFKLGTQVDPSTLEYELDNGVLEGVVKKKWLYCS